MRMNMNDPRSGNTLRITREEQPLIKAHYLCFIVQWMLIFFSFFFPAPVANFLLPIVLLRKTKQNTRHNTTNHKWVYVKKYIFILFQGGSQDPDGFTWVSQGPKFERFCRGVQPTVCGPHEAQEGYECGPTQNRKFT